MEIQRRMNQTLVDIVIGINSVFQQPNSQHNNFIFQI